MPILKFSPGAIFTKMAVEVNDLKTPNALTKDSLKTLIYFQMAPIRPHIIGLTPYLAQSESTYGSSWLNFNRR